MLKEITHSDYLKIIDNPKTETISDSHLYWFQNGENFTAIDNTSKVCWVGKFDSLDKCINWLNGSTMNVFAPTDLEMIIDYRLLYQQKNAFMDYAFNNNEMSLDMKEGLLNFLESILEEAEDKGYFSVYQKDEEE